MVKKTSFVHVGTYQHIRFPFGSTSLPATYHFEIDMVLAKYQWKTSLVYFEDVIIYCNSVQENINSVDEILNTLAKAEVTNKMKKITLFRYKVEYLGHLTRP